MEEKDNKRKEYNTRIGPLLKGIFEKTKRKL